jgi:hypothetical protein
MKLELVEEMSFAEYNERLYYERLQDEQQEKSRRDFLRYLVVGSAGLLVPAYYTKDSEANPAVFAILALQVVYWGLKALNEGMTLAKNTGYGCSINLQNRGSTPMKAPLECYAKNMENNKYAYSENQTTKDIKGYTFSKHIIDELPEIDVTGEYIFGVKSLKRPKNHIKTKVTVV